ncbi:hypothetical protein EGU64_31715 [Achromobacter denitrificans]|nr:hypothetical protein EGU64_31715 [Achromobacter denitrificans]
MGAGVREKLSARSVDEPPLRRRLSLCNSDVLGMGAAAEVIGELIPELVRDLVASGRWAGAHLL